MGIEGNFSQRMGLESIRSVLQIDSIDDELRNGLWNSIYEVFFGQENPESKINYLSQNRIACRHIWKSFFKLPIDKIPMDYHDKYVSISEFIDYLNEWFYEAPWNRVYDLIEYLAWIDSKINKGFISSCNRCLTREMAGYRIVNTKVVEITSEEEIKEIAEAANNTSQWYPVRTHLAAALDFLSDRENPNHRNSIKESISAVESLCKIITGNDKATLGQALSIIEQKHKIHSALKMAFKSIYGYTSDSGGIRHSLIESDKPIEFEEAKFMLVSCSAFVNYLKSKIDF